MGNGLAIYNDARSRGWSDSVTLADLERISAGNPLSHGIEAVWPSAKSRSSVDIMRQYLPKSLGDFFGDREAAALQPTSAREFAGDVLSAGLNVLPAGRVIAPRQGIRAYHVSPYDFDKFSMDHIGNGEGAQSYGHGLYFAENPKVSGGPGSQYWNQFAQRFIGRGGPQDMAVKALRDAGGDTEAAIAGIQTHMPYENGPPSYRSADAATAFARQRGLSDFKVEEAPWYNGYSLHVPNPQASAAINLLRSGKPVGPVSYEVNINAKPEQFLDWDKPIGQQPLQAGLDPLRQSAARSFPQIRDNPDLTGQGLYQAYAQHRGGNAGTASEAIRDAGIPGIRYLDQGSRSEGAGTSNYVLFNDKIIDIMKKWGLAGAAIPLAANEYDGRF